jgi:magnesium-transporting ATPase (P-type)
MAADFPKHPFLLSVEETASFLGTDIDKGLSSHQVAELSQKYPKNELDVGGTVPWYSLLAKQVLNAMIIVSFH